MWRSICGTAHGGNGWEVKGEGKHWNWSLWMLSVICQAHREGLHTGHSTCINTHTFTDDSRAETENESATILIINYSFKSIMKQKCHSLVLVSVFCHLNLISSGFKLLVGQNQIFKDVTLASGKLWRAIITILDTEQLIQKQIWQTNQ